MGVSVFYSCKSGQAALEINELRHGLFFHHVLEGMRGKAANRKGNITWQGLSEYAAQSVLDSGFRQVPVLKGEIEGVPILISAPSLGSATFEGKKTHLNSLGINLVRIEPGRFTMGSPAEETGRDDDEDPHPVEITQGFFLSQHEVTRGQFRVFVANTKYQTDAEKNPKGGWGFDPATKTIQQSPPFFMARYGFSPGRRSSRRQCELA